MAPSDVSPEVEDLAVRVSSSIEIFWRFLGGGDILRSAMRCDRSFVLESTVSFSGVAFLEFSIHEQVVESLPVRNIQKQGREHCSSEQSLNFHLLKFCLGYSCSRHSHVDPWKSTPKRALLNHQRHEHSAGLGNGAFGAEHTCLREVKLCGRQQTRQDDVTSLGKRSASRKDNLSLGKPMLKVKIVADSSWIRGTTRASGANPVREEGKGF